MIAPRKYVHLLLILSELILIGVALTMIIIYNRTDWDRKIWMGSKILSLRNVLKYNSNETYPKTTIGESGSFYSYKSNYNYDYLLKHSGSSCEAHYKRCGILDTMKNIMCIPETDECPINEVRETSLEEINNKSLSFDATEGHLITLESSKVLYYSNKNKDKDIVVKVSDEEKNKIIDTSNFVFDYETYEDSLTPVSSGDGGDWGGYDGGGGGDSGGGDSGGGGSGSGGGGWRKRKRKLSDLSDTNWEDTEYKDYINERFDDDINIDKSYIKIFSGKYTGNYLGFKDYSTLEKFTSLNLYDLYFIVFPNKAAYIFCYILIIAFIVLIVNSMKRFLHKDVPNEGFNADAVLFGKLTTIIPYLIFYVGFFLYITYEYDNIYFKLGHEELLEVKADPFFEDLLKEIYERNPKPYVMIIFILMYILSLGIFILAWYLSHRFTKKYMSLLNKT